MYQIFRKIEASADRSSAMECRDHSKNTGNPKSQTSKGNIMQRAFLFFAVFFVSVACTFAQDIVMLKNGENIHAIYTRRQHSEEENL